MKSHGTLAFALATLWLLSAGVVAALPIDFSDYHNPDQVNAILDDLAAAYPTLCAVSSVGNSIDGLPIKVLKISDNVATDESDEGDVVFFGLHHAREWITVEMALYLAEHLLTSYGSDPTLTADINNLEIWIIPVVNPDGFEYTQLPPLNPGDPMSAWPRYWRKNRRDNGDGSHGVDLNRNWGYQWGLLSGSSNVPANDLYHGTGPFSEPETSALRDLLLNLDNLKTLLSYHSFSQFFLPPWSYTNADPPGKLILDAHVDRAIDLIHSVHGVTYTDSIWYTSSGETTDYLWGQLRDAAFTPELRPATGGLAGFSPPPSTIIPAAEENLPVALAMIHDAGDREVWIKDHSTDDGSEPSAVWTGSGWSHAFWTSPDIWTDPAILEQGATVDLHVRVRNNSGAAMTGVTVAIYYTDPRISLEFPNPAAILIDSSTITVPAAGTTITRPWTVPIGGNSWGELHWCVGAIVMHSTDLPLTTDARRTSNIGIRNFNTEPMMLVANTFLVTAANFLDTDAELVVNVDPQLLPDGWQAVVPTPPRPVAGPRLTAIERKARLLGATGRLLTPGETIYIPVRVIPPDAVAPGTEVDVSLHAALIPLVAGERPVLGNGYTYRLKVTDCP